MAVPPHELYVSNADAIERVIANVCRRHRIFGADAEDFAGIVRLQLIEDDYAILRKFEGRSTISSYLLVVVTRQFQDWRNARWGKWRPSAEARRQGDVAVRLETLTVRDGLSLDEAYEWLRTHLHLAQSRAELEQMAARFPHRARRLFVDDETMQDLAAPGENSEGLALSAEAGHAARRAADVVTGAVRQLPPQDRLIIRMRFEDNVPVVEIARALHLEAKPLYRRIDKLLHTLRTALESAGLTAADAAAAWSDHGFDVLDAGESGGEVRPFVRTGDSPALTGGHRD